MLALVPFAAVGAIAERHLPNRGLVDVSSRPHDIKLHLRDAFNVSDGVSNNVHPTGNMSAEALTKEELELYAPLCPRTLQPFQI
jgi:hypothetical protein